jgi:hypothetical protein
MHKAWILPWGSEPQLKIGLNGPALVEQHIVVNNLSNWLSHIKSKFQFAGSPYITLIIIFGSPALK